MNIALRAIQVSLALVSLVLAAPLAVRAQDAGVKPFKPYTGQPGRDVIWVPTPDVTVQKMLDIARLTREDYVIDLGSGDGRMVIAAAKRGARGHGVEYNSNMVELSIRLAREAGVSDMARFIEGDMFVTDMSRATVLPLFLLNENLNQLTPNFLKLRPGTRIVTNGFTIDGWTHDESATAAGDCGHWCNVFLYIVPAQTGGAWRLGEDTLTINQEFQKFTGRLGAIAFEGGRVNGGEITFTAGKTQYNGRITGNEMHGEAKGARPGAWSARRE